MNPVVDTQLPSNTGTARQARQCVADLGNSLSKNEAQDISLLVSELVTNSVLHAGLSSEDLIGLKIYLSMTLVRTEVRNSGSGFELGEGSLIGGGPLDNVPQLTQTSGWGLQLVARIADRWGVEPEAAEQMTLVWFEFDRDSNGSDHD